MKRIRYSNYILITILLLIATAPLTFAEEKELEVSLDANEISLGGSIRMDIIFPGIEDMPVPDLPDIDGFQVDYLRAYNFASKTDKGVLRSMRYTYILMPQKTGTFQIGPFAFPVKSDIFKSKKLIAHVISSVENKNLKTDPLSREEQFRAKDNIFLLIATGKNKVYLNETFPFAVGLYYKDVPITDIEYPVIEQKGLSVGEFNIPQTSRKDIKGYAYRIITYKNKAFATKPGVLRLGPATIMCKVQKSSPGSLSGSVKKTPLNLESTVKDIDVLPLPRKEMPDDFSGAVGDFKFKATANPVGYVNIGDAITITMEITGTGNFDIMTAPSAKEKKDLILYDPTLKSQSETSKVFEQIVVPNSIEVKQIPKVRFTFFNPKTAKYEIIEQGPYKISVFEAKKSKKAQIIEESKKKITEPEKEAIGKDIIYIKDFAGRFNKADTYLYQNKQFLLFHVIPLLIYISTLVTYTRYQKLKSDIKYARNKFAYKKAIKNFKTAKNLMDANKAEEFYACLYMSVQEYLGDKLNLPPGGITAGIADTILKKKGVDRQGLLMVKSFFHDSDIARFTPAHSELKNMLVIFDRAEKIAKYFKNI